MSEASVGVGLFSLRKPPTRLIVRCRSRRATLPARGREKEVPFRSTLLDDRFQAAIDDRVARSRRGQEVDQRLARIGMAFCVVPIDGPKAVITLFPVAFSNSGTRAHGNSSRWKCAGALYCGGGRRGQMRGDGASRLTIEWCERLPGQAGPDSIWCGVA